MVSNLNINAHLLIPGILSAVHPAEDQLPAMHQKPAMHNSEDQSQ